MPNYYLNHENSQTLSSILLGIYVCLYLPSSIMLLLRRHLHPIKLRGLSLALFHTFIPLLELIVRLSEGGNCWVKNSRTFLLVPLWIYPYYFRALQLWYRYNFQILIASQHPSPAQAQQLKEKEEEREEQGKESQEGGNHAPPKQGEKIPPRKRLFLFLLKHQFLLSLRFAFFFLGCLFAFFFTSALLMMHFVGADPETCDIPNSFVFYAIPIGAGILLIFIFQWLLWNVHDPYLIKVELRLLLIMGLLLAPPWAAAFLKDLGIWDEFFMGLLEIFSLILSLILPLVGSFFFSKWMKMAKIATPETSEKEIHPLEREFLATLEHPILAASFERFTIECWCSELLIFYRLVQEFKDPSKSEEEKIKIALDLCENFVLLGSKCEINIDSEVREKITGVYNARCFTPEMFEEAEDHCLSLLKFSVFPLWKESSRFRDCLKKLKMKSIQEYIDLQESLELDNIMIATKQGTAFSLP